MGLAQQWAVFAAGIAAAAALFGYDAYARREEVRELEAYRLQHQARVVDANFGRRIVTTANALDALRADLAPLLRQPDKSAANGRITAMVRSMNGVRSVVVVDTGGIVVASNVPETIGRDLGGTDRVAAFRRAPSADTLYVAAPFKAVTGFYSFSLGRAIVDGAGRFAGGIVAVVDPDYFSIVLESVRYAPDVRVALVHGDGTVIFRMPDPGAKVGIDYRDASPLFGEHLRSGRQATRFDRDGPVPGEDRMGVFWTVRPASVGADAPLVVTISRDNAAAFAQWRADSAVRAVALAAIALVAATALALVQRRRLAYERALAANEAERRRAEEARRRSEELFRRLFEDSHVPLVVLDPSSLRFTDCNQAAAKLFGFPDTTGLIGGSPLGVSTATQYDGSASADALSRPLAATLAAGDHTFEWRAQRPGGDAWDAEMHAKTFRHDGRVLFQIEVRDVTEHRRVERELEAHRRELEDRVAERTAALAVTTAELRELNARQQAIFDAAGSGIALTRNRVIVDCNRRLCEIIGWSATELKGTPTRAVFASDADYDAAVAASLDASRGGTAWHSEQLLRRRDGSQVWTRIAGTALDASDPALGMVWIADDITDERAAREELVRARAAAEAASEAKSVFLANMSHELRTPLNGILGMAYLLKRSALEDRQQEQLARIVSSANQLLGIINDVLHFVRVDTGMLLVDRRVFDVEALMQEAAGRVREKAALQGIALAVDVDAGVPRAAHGDAAKIQQVLHKLAENAVKFTGAGQVRLRVAVHEREGDDATLRFEVVDTGIGLDAEERDRVFEPFEQADNSRTRRFGGAGLGLAIARRLVEWMDGRIGVESEKGRGSTFWFTVPVQAATGDADAPQEAVASATARPVEPAAVADAAGAPANARAESSLARDEALSMLVELERLLATDDIRAIEMAKASGQAIGRALGADATELCRRVASFDFGGALAELRRLSQAARHPAS